MPHRRRRRHRRGFTPRWRLSDVTCPTPGKRCYASEGMAQRTIDIATLKRIGDEQIPTRAYMCTCGYWHLATT